LEVRRIPQGAWRWPIDFAADPCKTTPCIKKIILCFQGIDFAHRVTIPRSKEAFGARRRRGASATGHLPATGRRGPRVMQPDRAGTSRGKSPVYY
jgi:hypothetical protein